MIRKKSMLLACLFFSLQAGFAVSIHSLQELFEQWESSDENTLVVFDIDEVLITTEDHFMHPYAQYSFYPLILKYIWTAKTQEEKKELENCMSLSFLLPKKILIEEETPAFIATLQQKKVKVIGLTHSSIGEMGLISDLAIWKINCLKEFNINFSTLGMDRVFLEMESPKKYCPLLQDGILFANGHEKGGVLKSFFKQCNFYPSKVIFIDDLSRNIENVQTEMQLLGIECYACQYLGANRFFRSEVDMDILTYQVKYLLENKQWIDDREAQIKLLEAK